MFANLKRKLGQASIQGLISVFILLMVGLALAPTVANQAATVTNVTANANVTAAGAAMFAIIPLAYAIILVVSVLGVAVGLR